MTRPVPLAAAMRPPPPSLAQAALATRLAFFIAGFGLACWAPMVPYAKARIGASHAELGSVLLCLGLGSILGMPAAGALANRLGSKALIVCASLGLALALPLLAGATHTLTLAAALLLFGLTLGMIDVAANIHGSEVQQHARRPLMSGFHGLYSVGGLFAATAMTTALTLGLPLPACALVASALVLSCVGIAAPRFLATHAPRQQALRRAPHAIALLLGGMAMLVFLVEGAVLDWAALLLVESKRIAVDRAGAGYASFALAMTLARLGGDRLVMLLGERACLLAGAILTGLGVALAAWAHAPLPVLTGFALAGAGAANIVPVLFSMAGRQTFMPATQAIAVTSTLGYLGVFLGPGAIGHVAELSGLPLAFGGLALLMLLVAGLAGPALQLASDNPRS